MSSPDFATQAWGIPPWIGDMTIDGTNATGTAVGFQFQDTNTLKLHNLCVRNFTAGTSSYGLDFYNNIGWSEENVFDNVAIHNCNGTIHFSIGPNGFPSFDYWTFESLFIDIAANQSGFVEEASSSTTNNPSAQIQHEGCFIRMTTNANNGATNTGALFWFKGDSEWKNTNCIITGEIDGGGAVNHTSFIFGGGAFDGFGHVQLGGAWQSPTFNGGPYQILLNGYIGIPGWGSSTASMTIAGGDGVATYSLNAPGAASVSSGAVYVNSTGCDIIVEVAITMAAAATLKFVRQSFTISAAGPTVLTNGAAATAFIWPILVHFNEQIRLDVSSGTIAAINTIWK
jgi:hypothetical protein